MAPCTIRWCGYNSQTSSFRKDCITFHRYPQDPDIKNKWIIATKRENWFPTTHSVICSRHFTEDCFMPMKNRRRLLSSAVPTMYLPLLRNAVDSDVPIPSTSKPGVKIKDLPIASTSTASTFTKTNSPVSTLGTSKQVPNENSLKSPLFIPTPKKRKRFSLALVSLNQNQNSLIAYRDKGGLIYPSPTVVKICRRSEVNIKAYLQKMPNNQKRKTDVLVNKTLSSFIGEELFSNISNHQFQSEVTNHVVDLSMCVMHKYISTRLAFLTKSAQHKHTVRRIYTKLIHFKND